MKSLSKIKRIIKPRKLHLLCLGAAKTGTTSLSAMFNQSLRSSHEPEVARTTNLVIDHIKGSINQTDCINTLIERDNRLYLDIEASHPLGYLAEPLVKAFPEAKFIVTIRHPHSWLKSRLNFHLYRTPDEWKRYRDFIWSRWHTGYANEEKLLESKGLYSLEGYLRQYSEQYEILFTQLPADKYIVVKTEELDSSIPQIARFLNIPTNQLEARRKNTLPMEEDLIDLLDPDFVENAMNTYCNSIISTFYKDYARA